jgi:hypothetical protein
VEHRASCQRQHRVLGHYLAVQAWLRGVDCIVVERQDLEAYLGLQRFKSERIRWLLEDLIPWFPYNSVYYMSSAESSLHSLFLARVEIESWLPESWRSTVDIVTKLKPDAPKMGLLFSPDAGKRRIQESEVVRYLAILDSGLVAPGIAISG